MFKCIYTLYNTWFNDPVLDFENCNIDIYYYFRDDEYLLKILDVYGLTFKTCCFRVLDMELL